MFNKMSITDEAIKARILNKLMRFGKWQHSHTSVDNLTKSFAKDLRGRAKGLVDELIKSGFLLPKSTCYGKEVSLNVRLKAQIEEYVQKHMVERE